MFPDSPAWQETLAADTPPELLLYWTARRVGKTFGSKGAPKVPACLSRTLILRKHLGFGGSGRGRSPHPAPQGPWRPPTSPTPPAPPGVPAALALPGPRGSHRPSRRPRHPHPPNPPARQAPSRSQPPAGGPDPQPSVLRSQVPLFRHDRPSPVAVSRRVGRARWALVYYAPIRATYRRCPSRP